MHCSSKNLRLFAVLLQPCQDGLEMPSQAWSSAQGGNLACWFWVTQMALSTLRTCITSPKKCSEGPIHAPLQRCLVLCETLQGILPGSSSAQTCRSCVMSVDSLRTAQGIANSNKCRSMGSRTKPKRSASLYRKGHQNWEITVLRLPDQLQFSSSCIYMKM